MRKLLLALPLLLPTAIAAQTAPDEPVAFYVAQPCYPLGEFLQTTIYGLGEQSLFTGTGFTQAQDGETFEGAVMFFVNQDTGSWTLGTLYPNGMVCLNAWGIEFEPYAQ